MHQAFTGSTRKARHVNLSGRPASNPWATLPGSSKSSHGQPGANSTLAQAQADRQRRQNERDRLTASKKVQKIWRGHACRRKQKAKWRQEWDENESQRLNGAHDASYEHVLDYDFTAPAYTSADLLLSQLRLLNHFQEYRRNVVRHEVDTARVLFFANALRQSTDLLPHPELDDRWEHSLCRLGITAARHIQSIKALHWNSRTEEAVKQLSTLISFLTKLVPEQMSQRSALYMHVIRDVMEAHTSSAAQEAGIETLTALLLRGGSSSYDALIKTMLSDEGLSHNLRVLTKISLSIDEGTLARELLAQSRASPQSSPGDQRLWQLSYLIFMHREGSESFDRTGFDFIQALSVLLGSCSSAIRQRIEGTEMPRSIDGVSTAVTVPQFIKSNISTVYKQAFVQRAISMLSRPVTSAGTRSVDSDFEVADHLAGYALSMMSAFESQKANMRQMLYQSSVTLSSGRSEPTISYFWAIVSKTRVFQQIVKDDRKVMSVLTEAAPYENQIGRPAISDQQVHQWSGEWRIVLAFLELYNFALKLMDDEDFFSTDQSQTYGQSQPSATQWRKGALPLSEVAVLITFLKHLAFTLYWNAAQLVQTDEDDEPERLAVLLGSARSERRTSSHADQPASVKLAGNDVTHAYLKDLTTGLLRMLHERDSRRRFLGEKHFLMTDQVDLTGFISDVVTEEEKRYEMQDEEDEVTESVEVEDVRPDEPDPEDMITSFFGIRQPHAPRSYASRQAQMREQQKTQASKRRQMQLLAPRLEILRNLPFFIPFEMRVQIFRGFIHKDQIRRREGYVDPDNWRMHVASSTQGRDLDGRPRGFDIISRHHAEIHRESVFEDAFAAYYSLGEGLKEPIQISFIDKFGSPEAGIDGGGVTKEFLMSVTGEALDPVGNLAMFTENEQRYLYPNPLIMQETSQHLERIGLREKSDSYKYHLREFMRRYEFLGRVIGKCLYEGILIDVNFAGFFLLKWALTGGTTTASTETAYRASINDLRDYDEALYQGLLKLKNYTGDVESDFGLNFTVSDEIEIVDAQGRKVTKTDTKNLITDGADIAVTNSNKYVYIDRIVRYRLQHQPSAVTNAFLRGLGQIIQPMWLAMFNQKELQKLVGGDNTELDIADLRRNTQYGGLYVIGDDGLEHPTVELFWKVLKDMDDADRRKVLKFVTSTPRAPLLGFSHLNPKFSIRDSSEDQERLPSTSTCVNLLKLPRYGDMKTMKEKLLYAVHSGAGFDLS